MKAKEEKTKKHFLKKKENSQKIPEFVHPIQTWIYKCSPIIVDSLIASLASKSLGEFFKNSNAALFKENDKLDQIIKDCFFIRLNKESRIQPEQLIKQLVTGGEEAYILYGEEQLFYIDHYANVHFLPMLDKDLKLVTNIFPDISNFLHPGSINGSLDFIQKISNFPRKNLIDEIGILFGSIKEEKNADDFFKYVSTLNNFLFSPIKKSPAWENFCKNHKNKFEKINLNQLDSIASAFTIKLLSFWINQCEKIGKLDKEIEQSFEAVSIICSHPDKAFFLKECKTKLQFEIKQQMSNCILDLNKTDGEKIQSLMAISNNIYFKLLAPQSTKIYNHEIKKAKEIFEKVLIKQGLSNSEHLIESNNESSGRKLFRSKSLSKIIFTNSKDSIDELDNAIPKKASITPLSSPINISNKPNITIPTDSLPTSKAMNSRKELVLPNLSKLERVADESQVSLSRRNSPRPNFLTKIIDSQLKKEDCALRNSAGIQKNNQIKDLQEFSNDNFRANSCSYKNW